MRRSAAPAYFSVSGRLPCTAASGPSIAQNIGNGDLGRRPCELVAAFPTTACSHDPGTAEISKDIRQEPRGDVLAAGELFSPDRSVAFRGREFKGGPNGVVRLGTDPHVMSFAARSIDHQLHSRYFVDRHSREYGSRTQWDIALAGLIVGCVIGLTGMGGGALMTPVLVVIFHVTPSAAISSDIVASFFLKPIGGSVHVRHRTVNWRLVRWLSVGSVPAAFAGAYIIDQVASKGLENEIKQILGVVLLIAAAAMLVKVVVQARRGPAPTEMMDQRLVRPVPTLCIGAVGGFLVGMTSVGSGSLMIVMLMLLYPALSSREMVGTDLVQAIPLVGAAASDTSCSATSRSDSPLPCSSAPSRASTSARTSPPEPATATSDQLLVAVLSISALKLLNVSNDLLLGSIIAAAVALTIALLIAARHKNIETTTSLLASPRRKALKPNAPDLPAKTTQQKAQFAYVCSGMGLGGSCSSRGAWCSYEWWHADHLAGTRRSYW